MFERGAAWSAPFWAQPTSIWDDMFAAGVRAQYVTSQRAAPLLIKSRGLVISISFFAATRHQGTENIPYFLAKGATDRMALALANHLRPHGVTSLSLYPGLVRTEAVLHAPAGTFDFSNSESPQFIGRAVAALASDPAVFALTGQVLVAAELGEHYGFTDVDGTRPKSLRAEWGGAACRAISQGNTALLTPHQHVTRPRHIVPLQITTPAAQPCSNHARPPTVRRSLDKMILRLALRRTP
ncbi:SDR family oxidoreductase [Deinococcus sp. Arct2-2]|uniref:SDR family oxidoreductase n=1 Tax=Deinococcus sp. Arct2-2 TaxID=2568653 RepID=UPI0023EF4DCD|nr:SDR family oxidoreductase [Deinococcus sp. Arct2-2]